jgi:dienelactone hydrolase
MKRFLLPLLLLLPLATPSSAMTEEERKQYLENMLKTLPPVPSFTQWQQRTGELPPDFDALPRHNTLPDPLKFLNGDPVKTPEDWARRRAEIISLLMKYDIGSMPPKPKIDSIVPVTAAAPATATATATAPGIAPARGGGGRGLGGGARGGGPPPPPGSTTKIVDLKYGPDSQITTRVTLNIPPGDGPFPVLIGGNTGILARGYISCSFPSSVDAPPDIGKFYPDCDWGSMAKIAWTTQVVIDYLYTVPQVDKQKIATTGYSRDGKRALITAALDERIAAVIPASTGVGGVMAWRDGSERGFGESIESTTRAFPIWFTPRLRFFSGREDRLPIDGNLITALVAPRACLIKWADNDEVAQPWPAENAYRSALRAYQFLGKPDGLSTLHTPGTHASGMNQNTMLDWLDIQFGKSDKKWPNPLTYTYDYAAWLKASGETLDLARYPARAPGDAFAGIDSVAAWEKKVADIRTAETWMLGENALAPNAPPVAPPNNFDPVNFSAVQHGGSSGWIQPTAGQTTSRKVKFANGLSGDLWYTTSTPSNTRLPTVIWLHGYSSSLGYMWIYHSDLHPVLALAKAGYAVLAFDQTGFGTRQNEAPTFTDRYPHWSQMGQMVQDTRSAIDALASDPLVNPDKIYLYGYSMGGNLALHTAALDPRVKGVVSIAGFTPMRTDTPDRGTGGIARYYEERGLLPRLGFFAGNEAKIPYDYQELIAAIAPRPVYVLQPTLDRDANPADVRAVVDQARKIFTLYNAADQLVLDEPFDYNRLPNVTQDRIVKWMTDHMK